MEKKLRHSRQREMIYQHLKEEIQGLSLGTVYRNLKLLEELGKVRRVTSFQGTERYDACCGDHAHFLCERCGLLHDLGIANSQAIRDIIVLDDGFTLSKLDLTVTGLCPNCGG